MRYNELLLQLQKISEEGILDAKDMDRSENLHRLFMYPAMMVPATQSAIINIFAKELSSPTYAIDPFMGSGTSLLSCMEFGFNVFGQDINPFAVLLAKAKTYHYDIDELKSALMRIKKHIMSDESIVIEVNFSSIDKWFPKDTQIALSRVRRAICSEKNIHYRYFFWTLMSETIRVGSNDRTSTFKLHSRSLEELKNRKVDIIQKFFNIAECSIKDYCYFRNKLSKENNTSNINGDISAEIVWGNSQEGINTNRKFNLLVSSPPYGDNHTTVTYGQTSYLPLQWIPISDIECPYDYLKTAQEIDRQSLGGQINAKTIEEKCLKLFDKTKHLKAFYESLPSEERVKYNKTISFISDFDESLIKILEVMTEDAYYIWTIGNRFVGGREIPNAEILQDLMEHYGVRLFYKAERKILNKFQPCKNNYSRTMEKEQIMIFHR